MSPFEAVYGCKSPSISDYVPGPPVLATLDVSLAKRDQILHSLKHNIARAQTPMQNQANNHRQHKKFDVGDWVYLRLQPYRQTSVRTGRTTKLGRRFYCPFEITSRIGRVAYRLNLPPQAKIHNVFHVSLLRKCPDPSTTHVAAFPDDFIEF
ncbi:unnamed protein product [Rhodiola kirilowii]